MVITSDRVEILSKVILDENEKSVNLLELSPKEAVERLNALGYDYTTDELIEYGELVKAVSKNGELNANDLTSVSGGMGVFLTCAAAAGIAMVAGACVGGLDRFGIW